MKKFSKSHHGTMNELNITPLLDLAFVLLVIFIISTTPMVNDMDLTLPNKNRQPQGPAPKPHFLIVESDGRIFFDGQKTDISPLRTYLTRLQQQDKDTSVVVHGDAAVAYQVMVDVFDALQQAAVKKVGLATDRPSAAAMQAPQIN